jgi:hypothetical protein
MIGKDTNTSLAKLRYYKKKKKKPILVSILIILALFFVLLLGSCYVYTKIKSPILDTPDVSLSNRDIILKSPKDKFYVTYSNINSLGSSNSTDKIYSSQSKVSDTNNEEQFINLGKMEGVTNVKVGSYISILDRKIDFDIQKEFVFERSFQIKDNFKLQINNFTSDSNFKYSIESDKTGENPFLGLTLTLNGNKTNCISEKNVLNCIDSFTIENKNELTNKEFIEKYINLEIKDNLGNSKNIAKDLIIKLVKPLEAECTQPDQLNLNKGENNFICSSNNETTLDIYKDDNLIQEKISLKANEKKEIKLSFENGKANMKYIFKDLYSQEKISEEVINVTVIKQINLVKNQLSFENGKKIAYYTNGSIRKTNANYIDIALGIEGNYLDNLEYEVYIFDNKYSGEYLESKTFDIKATKNQNVLYKMPLGTPKLTYDKNSLNEVILVFYSNTDKGIVFECSVKQDISTCKKSARI